MLYLTFLLLLIPCSLQSSPLVFLTFSSNGQQLNVSMVSDQPQGNFVLEQDGQSQPLTFLYNISARQASNGSLSGEQPQTEQMFLYGVEIEVPTNASLLDYSLRDADNSNESFSVRLGSASSEANLSVCVFGDYRADMMYTRDLNLSAYAEMNGCQLLLFIGKISWEQRDCPQCNTSISSASFISSGNPEDLGLSFSPFSMLDDHMPASQISVFGKVPALFGATGQNHNETSFFDCTEVGGVALIQTTVELSTTAKLGSTESEQFKQVEHYFRETMLNELECKLQELHRRPQRPWILVYLTHPSLINEKETAILSLKDNDRFFDILNRYHVDLLLSCGVEGMAQILKERQQNKPAEELPPYLGTTMATCLDEKTCQYLVLDIGDQQLDWRFMDGAGTRPKQGQFQKSSQAVDKCVPDWIPSITGRTASNGTDEMAARRRRRR